MKNITRLIIGIFALCAFGISFGASPQTYLGQSKAEFLVNVPTSIAASTTATNTEIVDVTRHDVIGIQITARNVSTNASAALTIPIHRSLDGTNFEDTATTTLSIAINGTTLKTWYTNMTVGAARYLKFNQYANATTNIATNITVQISGKPPWNTQVSPVIQ